MLVFNLEGGTIKPKMNKTSGYENQAGCDELPKSCILHMSARKCSNGRLVLKKLTVTHARDAVTVITGRRTL